VCAGKSLAEAAASGSKAVLAIQEEIIFKDMPLKTPRRYYENE